MQSVLDLWNDFSFSMIVLMRIATMIFIFFGLFPVLMKSVFLYRIPTDFLVLDPHDETFPRSVRDAKIKLNYVEFVRRFSNGSMLQTNNSSRVGSFVHPSNHLTLQLPQVKNLLELHRIHIRACESFGTGRPVLTLIDDFQGDVEAFRRAAERGLPSTTRKLVICRMFSLVCALARRATVVFSLPLALYKIGSSNCLPCIKSNAAYCKRLRAVTG